VFKIWKQLPIFKITKQINKLPEPVKVQRPQNDIERKVLVNSPLVIQKSESPKCESPKCET
jgi:hypothetical protein